MKIASLHCRFDNPTMTVQENGTYGGQGKAVGRITVSPAALLCLCCPIARIKYTEPGGGKSLIQSGKCRLGALGFVTHGYRRDAMP